MSEIPLSEQVANLAAYFRTNGQYESAATLRTAAHVCKAAEDFYEDQNGEASAGQPDNSTALLHALFAAVIASRGTPR